MYRIPDDLGALIHSGPPTIVGTGDNSGRPHVAYGWAPRVHPDRVTVDVFLDKARSDKTIQNLNANGRIAMTVAEPVSYRSVQLKGRFRDSGEPDENDKVYIQAGREAFAAKLSLIGDPPAVVRNLWLPDTVRITFTVEAAFDQTPGPEAGKPL